MIRTSLALLLISTCQAQTDEPTNAPTNAPTESPNNATDAPTLQPTAPVPSQYPLQIEALVQGIGLMESEVEAAGGTPIETAVNADESIAPSTAYVTIYSIVEEFGAPTVVGRGASSAALTGRRRLTTGLDRSYTVIYEYSGLTMAETVNVQERIDDPDFDDALEEALEASLNYPPGNLAIISVESYEPTLQSEPDDGFWAAVVAIVAVSCILAIITICVWSSINPGDSFDSSSGPTDIQSRDDLRV